MNTNKFFTMKIFSLLLLPLALMLACCHSDPPKKADDPAPVPAVHYELVPVKTNGLNTAIKLPGQLAAWEQVSIFPKVNGYVKEVNVDIGSKVSRGQLLMTLEAPELEQSALQAKEKYARTRADLSIDREHYNRLLEASQTPGAISPLDLSSLKAKVESDSAVSSAAKTNWEMEQTMEAYLKVQAPFNGVITVRNVHPGALVSAEAKDAGPMLELKNVAVLRLQVDIPENLAGTMKTGDTISFYTSAFPGKKMTAHISRKSFNINAQFRSERIEADVANNEELLAPGMYADVIVYSKGAEGGFTVPRSSVVSSTERKYVLAIRSNQVKKIDVTSGIESGDFIEVFGNLDKGDSVIRRANEEIPEGPLSQ